MSEISFDKYAVKGGYHWVECFGPLHRINAYTLGRYEMVLAALSRGKFAPGSRILDAGCGDGALSGLLAMRLQSQIDGIDVVPMSIELARNEFAKRNLRGSFQLIDGYDYPFANSTFQAVVCSDVIEHVQKPADMLHEMWRVLAPGGTLVVTTPIRYTEKPLDRLHVQEWFPDEFQHFCSDVLGVPVALKVSHPVALTEIYASSSPWLGRLARLSINFLAKLGYNPFTHPSHFRAFSTQMAVAKKPL